GIIQNLSQREGFFGSITNDKEEVAETLYDLATMFPHSGSNHDKKENVNAALEAPITGQGASLCPEGCSPEEASKITSLNESIC
ncbi:hypothetical protein RYX36_019356, partial [Vicia faba]